MLAHYFARRRASHVHSDVAAADYDHFLADGEFVAQVHIEQEVDAFVHAIEVNARDAEIAAAMRADGDEYSIEPLAAQIGNREVAASRVIQFERDVASLKNFAHLRFDHVARQAVFRDSKVKHPARNRRGFENRDGVSHEGEVVRGRKSHRAATDYSYLIRK